MARFDNSSALAVVPVSEVKAGTYVRRIKVCTACRGDGCTDTGLCSACDHQGYTVHAKTYIRGHFERSAKRYALDDTDDASREIFVTGKTRVQIGFDY